MDLILWRHADAENGSQDSERKLTAKGIKQAARMAKWLRARLSENAVVLASPAKRAQQTARALTADYKTVTEIGTSASAKDVLIACGWPGDERTVVVVVGHQPTLGATAALLLTGAAQQWSLKKGAVVWIAGDAETGDASAILRAAISPDLL
jgi:phosphohistidine phosphatase